MAREDVAAEVTRLASGASASDYGASLRVERLEYVRLGERLAVVRLWAGLGAELCPPPGAMLVIGRGEDTTSYPARGCKVVRTKRPRLLGGELLWRAFFAVPLDDVEYPPAQFELTVPGGAVLALPIPDLCVLKAQRVADARTSSPSAGPVRRRVVVAATTLAIAGWAPGIALAATAAHHGDAAGRGSAAPRGARTALSVSRLDALSTHGMTSRAPGGSGGASEGRASIKSPTAGKKRAGGGKTRAAAGETRAVRGKTRAVRGETRAVRGKTRVAGGEARTPTPAPTGRSQQAPKATDSRPGRERVDHAGDADAAHGYGLAPSRVYGVTTNPAARAGEPTTETRVRARQDRDGGKTENPSGGTSIPAPEARPRVQPHRDMPPPEDESQTPAPVSTAGAAPTSSAAVPGLAPGTAAATAWSRLSDLLANGDRPPAFLIPIYKAAGHRYHVPWSVLAAINSIETNYGRNVNTSSAGAIGWMQFMPATWAAYGVAIGRHKVPDPYDPRDAIFSAARYLAANGAAHDLRKAIFAYNHATWYVDEVLWTAASIASHTPVPGSRVRVKLDAMLAMADGLNGKPYIWGGGHSNWAIESGYDCSGFVSTVLHAAGYLHAPQSTQTLPSQADILPGPGRYVTIFDRTNGGAADADHVIIDINGQWWESGGVSGAGVHRIMGISASYLLSFNQILHPRGL